VWQSDQKKIEKPFGTWVSPISSDLIVKSTKRYDTIIMDKNDIYWTEMRAMEKGVTVIVKHSADGTIKDMTTPEYNVRTKVHEYGGAAFTVFNETIFFVNYKDQRIYILEKDKTARPLTSEGLRFADLKATQEGLIAVAELHHDDQRVDNFLVLINLKDGSVSTLDSGFDFYAFPALSPNGKQLAWVVWNHPNMPWDHTELWMADLMDGQLKNKKKIAGNGQESIFQPQWSEDNTLYYVSDKTNWWNLYQYQFDGPSKNLWPHEAEFGLPLWVFGMSTYAFTPDKILCTYCKEGRWSLALLDPKNGSCTNYDLPGVVYTQIRAKNDGAAFIMASPKTAPAIFKFDFQTSRLKQLSIDDQSPIDPDYLSTGKHISYPSGNVRKAFAFYYPPQNKEFRGLKNELPPLIVRSHGGPTAMFNNAFDYKIQFWTSRGFAVLDVNYAGSTGYGKAYRDSLKESWGIFDVEDCEYGARFIAEKGLADIKRLAITGSSAGGFTTLCALTFGHTFSVGASHYGISDLTALARDTHKYELHYLESLVGPYPEREDLYRARSPIHFAEKLNHPIIFFQGTEDKIVPQDQSEKMYNCLKQRGIPTRLILYEGEQHGFRKAENIKDALEKELEFYLLIFCPKD
jgi:dipeptidyl aminopeptidase/acylaminoacyl peptidase